MKFTKPALRFDEQAKLLASRGLRIDDLDQATQFLTHVNYYRLAGYVLPFESDHATHQIRIGTRFEDVVNLYLFDRALRLLVMDAIEKIEVSVRTQWAYHFAHLVGPHGYLDANYALSQKQQVRQLILLASAIDESKETFVKHHREKYQDPDFPPVWVACELLSLGQLSQWYTLMKPAMRKNIGRAFRLDQQVLQSLLHHLTHVRNICAHHARLWNREFVITSNLPKKGLPELLAAFDDKESRKLYKSLCLITHMLDCIDRKNDWRTSLSTLLTSYCPDLTAMGFPNDWKERTFWKKS
jgi:abortive infection bacteriophage resistance protein